jgi:hypothetical protein
MKRLFVSIGVVIVLSGVLIARFSLVKADVPAATGNSITVAGIVYDESQGLSKPVGGVTIRLELCSSRTFSTTSSAAGVYRLVIPKKLLNQCNSVTLIARAFDAPYRRYAATIAAKNLIANPRRNIPLKPIVVPTPAYTPVPTYTPSIVWLFGTVYNGDEVLPWSSFSIQWTFCNAQTVSTGLRYGSWSLGVAMEDLSGCESVTVAVIDDEYGYTVYSADISVSTLLANWRVDIYIEPPILRHATFTPVGTYLP